MKLSLTLFKSKLIGCDSPSNTNFNSITRFMSLISYASIVYRDAEDGEGNKWKADFRKLLIVLNPVTHENVSTFSLLSASMLDSRPLPPYFPKPKPFALVSELEALDPNILSIKNINEPGFAAFAVITLATRCIGIEIEELIDTVTELVGTMDFSVYPIDSKSSSQEDASEKAKAD
jgi:hypothetical protein